MYCLIAREWGAERRPWDRSAACTARFAALHSWLNQEFKGRVERGLERGREWYALRMAAEIVVAHAEAESGGSSRREGSERIASR